MAAGPSSSADNTFEITYPQLSESDRRYDYPMALLKLALDKVDAEYTLIPRPEEPSHRRMSRMMESDGAWSVAFFGTSPEFESRLRPIRFPLYRGLLGNRIAITNINNLDRFAAITTAQEIMDLRLCQGIGWTDTAILEAAGFDVVTGEYTNLFQVTHANRCDAYTRAVFEPYAEVASHRERLPDLVVDTSLLIRYRQPFFIFVDPAQDELANAIEEGLNIALSDGSFEELFVSAPTIAEARELVNESDRVCIEIANPFLTAETRALPDMYWQGFSFGAGEVGNGNCRLLQ